MSTSTGCSGPHRLPTATARWRSPASSPLRKQMAVALIVAAGRGERLGTGRPKALVPLAGRPMLEWSVEALRAVGSVERIVVALPADELDAAPEGTVAVAGGEARSHSVREALRASGDGDPV